MRGGESCLSGLDAIRCGRASVAKGGCEGDGERPGDEHAEDDVGGTDETPVPSRHTGQHGLELRKAAGAEKEAVDGDRPQGNHHLHDAEEYVGHRTQEAEEEQKLSGIRHGDLIYGEKIDLRKKLFFFPFYLTILSLY